MPMWIALLAETAPGDSTLLCVAVLLLAAMTTVGRELARRATVVAVVVALPPGTTVASGRGRGRLVVRRAACSPTADPRALRPVR